MKKYIQEHKYVLLVLYLPIYLIWFALVERMVPSTEGCFVSYLPLDDKIPFLPGFILAYVLISTQQLSILWQMMTAHVIGT